MKKTEEEITQAAIEMLKTVYDPEIPVNIYDLGLIYKIDYEVEKEVLHVDMTLTAPNCPAADFIFEDVRQKLVSIDGPKSVDLQLVFEPIWDQDMMSEKTGCEIANRRAEIMVLKGYVKNELKPRLRALKQLYYSMNRSKYFNEKSYENKML